MHDRESSINKSIDFHTKMAESSRISSNLSKVIALGFGAMSGSGLVVAFEGRPIGAVATGVGGILSWYFMDDAISEKLVSKDNVEAIEEYRVELKALETTADLE